MRLLALVELAKYDSPHHGRACVRRPHCLTVARSAARMRGGGQCALCGVRRSVSGDARTRSLRAVPVRFDPCRLAELVLVLRRSLCKLRIFVQSLDADGSADGRWCRRRARLAIFGWVGLDEG